MQVKIHKFFNQSTRQGLFENVHGYVDKNFDSESEVERLRQKYGIERIYRFDLGENAEGCSPRVREFIASPQAVEEFLNHINEYPEQTYNFLRNRLADFFQLPRDWFFISTGLDSVIDLIARVFFEHKDLYVMPIPSFYLFENYSERMGAIPLFIQLSEKDNFSWTRETTRKFKEIVGKFKPKIAWIANPNNPTGYFIPPRVLHELIVFANSCNTFVVIDEAYGEYTDTVIGESSAASFVSQFENLMVLRTFSKKYGLASLRVGYMICSSSIIIDAMLVHRDHFPVPQISAEIAAMALADQEFLHHSREVTQRNRNAMFAALDTMPSFRYIPSGTNIFMLKNTHMDAEKLQQRFLEFGIITSPIANAGPAGRDYLRITLRQKEENEYFCHACRAIDRLLTS